jgi:hypothetical protein
VVPLAGLQSAHMYDERPRCKTRLRGVRRKSKLFACNAARSYIGAFDERGRYSCGFKGSVGHCVEVCWCSPARGLRASRAGCKPDQALQHRPDRWQNSCYACRCLPCFICQRSSTSQAARARWKKRAMNLRLLREALTAPCFIPRPWRIFCPESTMHACCTSRCAALGFQRVCSLWLEE